MYKIIQPDAWDLGVDLVIARVKRSSTGLGEHDRKTLLKRASHSFVDVVNRTPSLPGEDPIHLVAIGATEKYGANRNGDGFDERDCELDHSTFKKYAKFFRNHNNRPGDPSYGRVIDSSFSDPMKRIELLVGLNATKQAAERNHGFIADTELDMLDRGIPIPVSMACKVGHDVCSGCGNRAKTRADYCHGGQCKYGGLRDNIGRTFDDGHNLHAKNPNALHFDISRVYRGADRTAFVLGRLEKAASVLLKCGAELAEDFDLHDPELGVIDNDETDEAEYLHQLATLEQQQQPELAGLDSAFAPEFESGGLPPELANVSGSKLASTLGAFSRDDVLLSPRAFLTLVLGDPVKAAAVAPSVAACLPGIFQKLARSGRASTIRDFKHDRLLISESARQLSTKLASDYGLSPSHVTRRVTLAAVRGYAQPTPRPAAKLASAANRLAETYAYYQVAFLKAAAADTRKRLASLVVRRNALGT